MSTYDQTRWREERDDRALDAPDVTLLPRRLVTTRKPWTCYYCQHESPAGTRCYVQPFVEDGKFAEVRSCSPNADCIGQDKGFDDEARNGGYT
jgi:hypothetical protein